MFDKDWIVTISELSFAVAIVIALLFKMNWLIALLLCSLLQVLLVFLRQFSNGKKFSFILTFESTLMTICGLGY